MIDLIDIGLVLPGLGCSGWLARARRCWISGVRSFAILRRARVERTFLWAVVALFPFAFAAIALGFVEMSGQGIGSGHPLKFG